MRDQLSRIFVEFILPSLLTVLASGGAWALGQLALWLKTKGDATKTQLALMQLAFLAELVVADIEATLRPHIKDVTADGHLSPAEGERLKAVAMQRLSMLAKERGFLEAQKLLETMAPSGATFISAVIERAVAALPKPAVLPIAQMSVYKPEGLAALPPQPLTR